MMDKLPIHITEKAIAKVKLIMEKKSVPTGYGLRLGVNSANSCGATSYNLAFDTKKSTDDSYNYKGIDVFISKKQMLHIVDITLDYEEGKEVSGFKFEKAAN
jgi:iron-sulfur cluster assembly protein